MASPASTRTCRRAGLSLVLACVVGCGVQTSNLPTDTTIPRDSRTGIVMFGVDPGIRIEVRRGTLDAEGRWVCRRARKVAWIEPREGYVVLELAPCDSAEVHAISMIQDEGGWDHVAVEGTRVFAFDVSPGEVTYAGDIEVERVSHELSLAALMIPGDRGEEEMGSQETRRELAEQFPEVFSDARHAELPGADDAWPDVGEPDEREPVTPDRGQRTFGYGLHLTSDWDGARSWVETTYPGLGDALRESPGRLETAGPTCRGASLAGPPGAYAVRFDLPFYDFEIPAIPPSIPQ